MKESQQYKSQLTKLLQQIDRDLELYNHRLTHLPTGEKSALERGIVGLEALKAGISAIVYNKTNISNTTKRSKIGELPLVPIAEKIEKTQSQMDNVVRDSILLLSESFIDDFSRFIGNALTNQKFIEKTAPETLWCCCHDLMTIKDYMQLAILKGEYQRNQINEG